MGYEQLKKRNKLLTYLTITALNPFITSIKTRAVDMVTWFSVTTVTTRQQTPWAVGLCFAYLKKQKTKTKSEHFLMHQLWKCYRSVQNVHGHNSFCLVSVKLPKRNRLAWRKTLVLEY